MNWIIEHTPNWNSWIALLLYWLPLVLCAYGYTVRGVQKYRKELAERAKFETSEQSWYTPELTFGTLAGYAALTICPIANLFAGIFDVAPRVFGDFFAWVGKVLDIPLVPKREKLP